MAIIGWISPDFFGDERVCRVWGVFSEAVYFQDEQGSMLLLHDRRYGLLPFGIGVENLREWLHQYPIATGSKIFLKNRILQNPEAQLEILLETIAACDPPQASPGAAVIGSWIQQGEALLCQKSGSIGACLVVDTTAPDTFHRLCIRRAAAALTQLEARLAGEGTVEDVLEQLLGLGVGLTPSVDDFLTGFVYLLRYVQRNWNAVLPELSLLAEGIQTVAPRKTNPCSAAYLCAAAKGQRFSLLEDLLSCGSGSLRQQEINRLLAVGSSSGCDLFAGVIYGLRYLTKKGQV